MFITGWVEFGLYAIAWAFCLSVAATGRFGRITLRGMAPKLARNFRLIVALIAIPLTLALGQYLWIWLQIMTMAGD